MRDFRLPNVLSRTGQEGDYVVVDLEYAGPTGQRWNHAPLTGWDANTLTMVRRRVIKSYVCLVLLVPCCLQSLQSMMLGRSCRSAQMVMPRVSLQGVYDAMSDMYQIGLMIDSLPLWERATRPKLLSDFVELLLGKQLTASAALCHPWITSAG